MLVSRGQRWEESTMGVSIDDIQKKIEKSGNQTTAIYIAALAAILALCSMLSNDAAKTALAAHIEAANQFAFFQAKNIRLTNYVIAAELLRASRPEAENTIKTFWQKANRYQKEKKEILTDARAQQAIRSKALAQARYYDYAIAMMQIAIVVASASIVTAGPFLVTISVLIALIGGLLAANGYFLYVPLPYLG